MRFTLLSPHTIDYGGHKYVYSKCLEKACFLNGWEWDLVLPWFSQIDSTASRTLKPPIPRSLYPLLLNMEYRGPSKWKRFKAFFAYGFSLGKSLLRKNNTLFFIETFFLYDLEILSWALRFIPKKNLSLALIHRYHWAFFNDKTERYLFLLQQLMKKVPKLYFFTDTEPLKIAYEKKFSTPVTLLPIPHLEDISQISKKEKGLCWWPGEPRKGKGLAHIQTVVQWPEKSCFTLALSKKAPLPEKRGGIALQLLEYPLAREKYIEMLKRAEFILLPYQDPAYEYSSSGIFAETIMAGGIPLVTPKTWMAFELKKWNLGELIIEDWGASLLGRLKEFQKSEDILLKLQNLRKEFMVFHTQERFTSLLKQGINRGML